MCRWETFRTASNREPTGCLKSVIYYFNCLQAVGPNMPIRPPCTYEDIMEEL
jgi:hypothetical protein